jgi:ribosomal protein S18 acetylase RimI-like enzyme
MSIMTRVAIYHLEMTDKANFRPSGRSHPEALIQRAEVPNPEFNRFLYSAVGGEWHWHERLSWSYERWMQWLDRAEQETWVAYVRGTPAGYVELELQPTGSVEIAYFGLLPQFIGQNLGGQLLSFGIQRGWDLGAERIWVHTCSLDHPNALRNYQARGLRIFKEEEKMVLLPGDTPGPWPNAQRAPYIIKSPVINTTKES